MSQLKANIQELRMLVENNICQSGGPDATCFVRAQELSFNVLERVYYPQYEKSSHYSHYLLEVCVSVLVCLFRFLNNNEKSTQDERGF